MAELDDRNANEGNTVSGIEVSRESRERTMKANERLRDLASAGRDRVVTKLDNVAQALHRTSEQMSSEPDAEISRYAKVLGERVERVSRYLKEHEPSELGEGLERGARDRPLLYLGGAFAIGVVIGRLFRSHQPEVRLEQGYAMGGYPASYGREDEAMFLANEGATIRTSSPPNGTFRGIEEKNPVS